ncbi:hypothetical protein BHE90_009126 [Fusarium euwallaceae]|uniref:Uncharacterized protein n=1 Tax=Fusarium euwallaceae TaxID=1147111 RepID=A0A430LL07_9HYPO|nr:hypothetical protein BHE90_009126 [Fusarium euwallaceae]
MHRDSGSPSQHDVHAESVTRLQASLHAAKEVIRVFTSTLVRTSLLRSGLVLLQLKLDGLSNPNDLVALDTCALSELCSCLQELMRQLEGLIDKDPSEDFRALSTATGRSVINLDWAEREEPRILESCRLLKLAIDTALPKLAAGIGDLIMDQDVAADQVEDVLHEAKNANQVCGRLEQVYELLSKHLDGCKSTKHVTKFHLSGLRGGIIGFLFSRCRGKQGWHPMPCRINRDTVRMPPFRDCGDFRLAEISDKCLTLNLGEDQKIFTKSVPKSSELGREYGTVPENFLTLKQVLQAENSDQTARATRQAGWRDLGFMTRLFQALKQEPNDEPDYRLALTENVPMVQYLLSESVLHLYNSPWLLDIWQPDQIEFSKGSRLLDFRKPYYSSSLFVELSPESSPGTTADLDPYHADTFMAKFGLLLLQLQLQQAFPLEAEDQSDDIWPSIALGRYYKDFEESIEPIKEVVGACLDFRRHLFEDLDAWEESDIIKFRVVFYKHILKPLRAILELNFPALAKEIAWKTLPQDEHQEIGTQPQVGLSPIGRNGASSRGETMLKSPASSTKWFNNLDALNEYLTAQTCEKVAHIRERTTHIGESNEIYEANRVKIAVIDSGLWEERQGDSNITYRNFIEEGEYNDDPQHGTNSVDLICKVYGRADLYVAKVFEGNEARRNTSKYMAEAIRWAISKKVDIISISAGFEGKCNNELEAQIKMATAGGAEPEILVFAAASNWQNISGVAYPASMADRVICIFCCNGGLKPSRNWNPNPRAHAANFAMLGEDVELDSGERLSGGTSVSTALAAGLAAKLLDFSRQPDVQSWMSKASRDKMRTKAGMSAILKEMSRNNVSEGYQCVAPWEILAVTAVSGGPSRKKVREAMCTIIEKAMKKA